jgi:hypothetical protein
MTRNANALSTSSAALVEARSLSRVRSGPGLPGAGGGRPLRLHRVPPGRRQRRLRGLAPPGPSTAPHSPGRPASAHRAQPAFCAPTERGAVRVHRTCIDNGVHGAICPPRGGMTIMAICRNRHHRYVVITTYNGDMSSPSRGDGVHIRLGARRPHYTL